MDGLPSGSWLERQSRGETMSDTTTITQIEPVVQTALAARPAITAITKHEEAEDVAVDEFM